MSREEKCKACGGRGKVSLMDKECEIKLKASEELARKFHETYERLAPDFGYKTREASAKPWKDVPKDNKQLMIAVCKEILQPYSACKPSGEFVRENRDFIRDANRDFRAGRVGKKKGDCVIDYVRALRELGKACDLLADKEVECERLKKIESTIGKLIKYYKRIGFNDTADKIEQSLQEKDNTKTTS